MYITSKSFIDNYLHSYHAMRADYLSRTLMKLTNQETKSKEEEANKNNYLYTVRIDIRSNAYHAAETLLDFLSVLIAEHKNGVDHDLGKALLNSKSSSAYDLANEIRTDPTYLDILKDSVEVHGHKTTLFGFCFHFGLFYEKGDYEERVAATLKIVRAAARLLGDREEYNAYKHSMRVVPNPLKMMLFKSQANRSREDLLKEKPDLTFETDAAVSFWTRIPKNNKELADEPVRSKSLHSPRDLNLATLCSMLITNIICARKPHFGADKNYKAWDDVYLPTKAKVDEALDQGPPIDDVEFRTTYVDLGRE